MRSLNLKKLNSENLYQRNILYKIEDDSVIPVSEEHTKHKETVLLNYILKEGQYGIFGYEYRSGSASSGMGWKTTDVLSCIVDEERQQVYSFILDIKRNISAFSEDLMKDNAVLTAIKEVRDFLVQLHDENLHKNSFCIYYTDSGFEEHVEFGIATRNFEKDKFEQVAIFLENLNVLEKPSNLPDLVWLKFKNSLMPYLCEAQKIKNFAEKNIEISGKVYHLKVFILEKQDDCEYVVKVPLEF